MLVQPRSSLIAQLISEGIGAAMKQARYNDETQRKPMASASERKHVITEPSRSPEGFLVALAALMIGGILSCGSALALGLDAIVEQSLLGQPLRIVIPVVAQPAEELANLCINIVPSSVEADEWHAQYRCRTRRAGEDRGIDPARGDIARPGQ